MLLGQDDKAEEWATAVGADLVATSLSQALELSVRQAQVFPNPTSITPAEEQMHH